MCKYTKCSKCGRIKHINCQKHDYSCQKEWDVCGECYEEETKCKICGDQFSRNRDLSLEHKMCYKCISNTLDRYNDDRNERNDRYSHNNSFHNNYHH